MLTLELKKHDVEVEIKHIKPVGSFIQDEIVELVKDMETFNSNVPLASITVTKEQSGEFSYQFTAKDGRQWMQGMDMNEPKDPAMTFNVPDGWRLSEFEYHRNIRRRIIELIRAFEVHELTANFPA